MKVFRTQVLTQADLNWYIRLNGSLVNVESITYEIQDISTGSPVTVVGPAFGINFAEGSYYAEWTVPDTEPIGTHRIIWMWKLTPTSIIESDQEEFEVLSTSGGPGNDLYVSLQDLYNDGLPQDKYTPDFLEAKILLVQDYIERVTGTYFRSRDETYKLDGSGTQLLKLPYPPLEITEVAFDSGFDNWQTMPTSWFEFYTDFEDRDYPRAMINQDYTNSVFGSVWMGHFPPGTRNIRITGKWGWVDRDGLTPGPIKDITIKILKKYLGKNLKSTPQVGLGRAGVISQTTDGHSYTIDKSMAFGTLTGYPEIDSVLVYYTKGPSSTIINRRSAPWS
jgi:hypothetical protein